jgi:hypothetical protein
MLHKDDDISNNRMSLGMLCCKLEQSYLPHFEIQAITNPSQCTSTIMTM